MDTKNPCMEVGVLSFSIMPFLNTNTASGGTLITEIRIYML